MVKMLLNIEVFFKRFSGWPNSESFLRRNFLRRLRYFILTESWIHTFI